MACFFSSSFSFFRLAASAVFCLSSLVGCAQPVKPMARMVAQRRILRSMRCEITRESSRSERKRQVHFDPRPVHPIPDRTYHLIAGAGFAEGLALLSRL